MERENSGDKLANPKRAMLSLTRFSTSQSDREDGDLRIRSESVQREHNSRYPEVQKTSWTNHWLSPFVVVARRQDGENYSLATLQC